MLLLLTPVLLPAWLFRHGPRVVSGLLAPVVLRRLLVPVVVVGGLGGLGRLRRLLLLPVVLAIRMVGVGLIGTPRIGLGILILLLLGLCWALGGR